jgi:ankyrin repeat protein
MTPLMHAAARNPDPRVLGVLLEAGARLDARNATGMTPLLLAAGFTTNPQVVMTLLASGADPHAVGPGGITAERLADSNAHLAGSAAMDALDRALR